MDWVPKMMIRREKIDVNNTPLYYVHKNGKFLRFCAKYGNHGWCGSIEGCDPLYGNEDSPTFIYHFTEKEIKALETYEANLWRYAVEVNCQSAK